MVRHMARKELNNIVFVYNMHTLGLKNLEQQCDLYKNNYGIYHIMKLLIYYLILDTWTQSVGAVEYINCISAEE